MQRTIGSERLCDFSSEICRFAVDSLETMTYRPTIWSRRLMRLPIADRISEKAR